MVFAWAFPGWNQLVEVILAGLQALYGLTGNGGIAIILFTILVKTLFIPLTLPALRNSRRQQELAPQVKEIMRKHGKDRAAASAEQMALYRQYGFNPLAGCLPTVVQIPVFFALYTAIRRLETSDMGLDSFLWIPRIAENDPYYLIPVIAAVAQFFQTRMAMQTRDKVIDAQQKQMNMMMQFMPLMVIVFGINFPAGAVLYWAVSSVFSALQQFFITGWGSLSDLFPFLPRKHAKTFLPPPKAAHEVSTKVGFVQRMQERMMEAQQQQEQKQKQPEGGTTQAITNQTAAPDPVPTDPLPEESVPQGNKYTEDAWQLPGAPGTIGKTVTTFNANSNGSRATAMNGQATRPARRQGQKPVNRNGSKKKRR